MKVFRFILIIIGIFIVLLFTVPLFLPSTSIVERSVEINKPIDEVYDLVLDFKTYVIWNPWVEMEKDAIYNVVNDVKDVGSKIEWDGDTIGRGYLERCNLTKDELIESDLIFINPWESKAKDIMLFEPTGTGTKVTWRNQMELEYPFGRYLGLAIEAMLGKDLEKGLNKLKAHCDTAIKTTMYKISEEKGTKSFYYFVSDSSGLTSESISKSLASAYNELMRFYTTNKLEIPKEPIAITTNHTESKWHFNAGFFAKDTNLAAKGRIQKGMLNADNTLKCVYIGPYASGYLAYKQLHHYMRAKGLEPAGNPWEVYVSDFKTTEEKDLITHIVYPVKKKAEKK